MLRLFGVLALAFVSGSGCALAGWGKKFDLVPGEREVLNVAYWQGDDFDDKKHRLDIFVPAPSSMPSPVLVFVHGGGWRLGDRQEIGSYYGRLGRELAARGVLTMVVSYRLAPGFMHPSQVRDVSRALAWTFAHAQDYGGDPERVFAMGHSAGAQLVALAACDPRWLQEVGASPSQLKGVIGISGPYDVEHMGHSTFLALPMVIPAFGTEARGLARRVGRHASARRQAAAIFHRLGRRRLRGDSQRRDPVREGTARRRRPRRDLRDDVR